MSSLNFGPHVMPNPAIKNCPGKGWVSQIFLDSLFLAMRASWFFMAIVLLSASGAAQQRSMQRSCPEVFEMHKGGEIKSIRYASNFSLNKPDTLIRTLVVYVHGLHRSAMNYFDYAMDAVRNADQKRTTLVIAPQFADEDDLDRRELKKGFLYWRKAEWKEGYASRSADNNLQQVAMSSFEVMDSLISAVLGSGNFPKLSKIIIAGHSAGGQFVQRYSATSPLPDQLGSVRFRFMVMNPSSYMYPDNKRPTSNGDYEVPDSSGCPGYNHYPKGLDLLSDYAKVLGPERILHNMLTRDIIILLGSDDTRMDDPDLDKSCASNLQGRFRLERGLYFIGLITSFPEYGNKKNFSVVAGVDHNGDQIINSEEARKWMFGW
jgi:pimeloyl-ACP methyl ester carboxylesterase